MAKRRSASVDSDPLFAVAGLSGLKRSAGYVDEEWRRRLKGTRAVKVYQEMGEDPICHAFLWMFEALIRQTDFRIEPNPNLDPTDERAEVAEQLDQRWRDMESTPDEVMSEVVSSVQYGFAVLEDVYKVRRGPSDFWQFNSRYNDGLIGWADMEIRSQDSLVNWDFDERGRVLAMNQQCEPDFQLRRIPLTRATLYRPRKTKNNPEGKSLLSGGAESEYYARRMRSIEAIGTERDLAGMPFMQLPLEMCLASPGTQQAAQRATWQKFVERIRMDKYHGVTVPTELDTEGKPTGYKLGLMTSGGRRPVDVDVIIKRHESRMLVAVLSELLLLGLEKVGSWALFDGKSDMLQLSLSSLLQAYAGSFTRHTLPRMCRLLGVAPENYPVMAFTPIESPDLAAFAGALSTLSQSGLLVIDDGTERFIRDTFGLPNKDPDAPLAVPLAALTGEGRHPRNYPTAESATPLASRKSASTLAKKFGAWLRRPV